jgi:hypothetical protein
MKTVYVTHFSIYNQKVIVYIVLIIESLYMNNIMIEYYIKQYNNCH